MSRTKPKRKMKRRRRCPACGHLFQANPRAGNRQRFCSAPECQRERHRRACKAWHAKNPTYNQDERLRKKLTSKAKVKPPSRLDADPLRQLALSSIRLDVGLVVVVLEEVSRVTCRWVHDAVLAELQKPRGPPSFRGSPARPDR